MTRRAVPEHLPQFRYPADPWKFTEVGFSLEELSEAFGQRSRGSTPCRRVHSLAKAKLSALDTRIEELLAARATLAARLDEWEQRLESEGDRPAHLLDSLIDCMEDV